MASVATAKKPLVNDLIQALDSPVARERFSAAKALRMLSEAEPQTLYSYFDVLAKGLDSQNSFLRWDATRTLANLASEDRQQKLDALLDRLLESIPGPQMIGAATAIAAAANVALAKPYLADRIAAAILEVRTAKYQTAECHHIAVGHAIESLGRFLQLVQDRRPVIRFVRAQIENPRAATRRKAETFLRRWS